MTDSTSPSRRQTSLRLSQELYETCRIEADTRGISINQLVIHCIESYLKSAVPCEKVQLGVRWWEKKEV
jgi:predicted HicB family RNase H-like nuclease